MVRDFVECLKNVAILSDEFSESAENKMMEELDIVLRHINGKTPAKINDPKDPLCLLMKVLDRESGCLLPGRTFSKFVPTVLDWAVLNLKCRYVENKLENIPSLLEGSHDHPGMLHWAVISDLSWEYQGASGTSTM